MEAQPIRQVDEKDISRLVHREFGPTMAAEVMRMLSSYGSEPWEREAMRVMAAVLKLAEGDSRQVEQFLNSARADYRDVLAWAEYPEYMRRKPWTLSAAEGEAIVEQDWQQYESWFTKP